MNQLLVDLNRLGQNPVIVDFIQTVNELKYKSAPASIYNPIITRFMIVEKNGNILFLESDSILKWIYPDYVEFIDPSLHQMD